MSVGKSHIPLTNVVPGEIKDTMYRQRCIRAIKTDDKRRKDTRYTDEALSDAARPCCHDR